MFCFGGGWEGRQEDGSVYEWTKGRDCALTEGPGSDAGLLPLRIWFCPFVPHLE